MTEYSVIYSYFKETFVVLYNMRILINTDTTNEKLHLYFILFKRFNLIIWEVSVKCKINYSHNSVLGQLFRLHFILIVHFRHSTNYK